MRHSPILTRDVEVGQLLRHWALVPQVDSGVGEHLGSIHTSGPNHEHRNNEVLLFSYD